MTAQTFPPPHWAGGRGEHVPTRRDIVRHLRAMFPSPTASAAERTARAALDVRRVRPEVDALRWAEADVRRRLNPARRLSYRGIDPVPADALHNLEAGVTR